MKEPKSPPKQQPNGFERKSPEKKELKENDWMSSFNPLQKGKLYHVAGTHGVDEVQLEDIVKKYFSEMEMNKGNIDSMIENFEEVLNAYNEGSL